MILGAASWPGEETRFSAEFYSVVEIAAAIIGHKFSKVIRS